jgi:tetratricopeptide (TPR) repeat protein
MTVGAAASHGALGEAAVPYDLDAAAVVYEPLLPDLAQEKLAYTHLLMSAYEQHSGRLPEAREELDRAIGSLESPAIYARSGELALSMQDLTRADTDSNRAIELDPTHADAHLTLGKGQYMRGRSNRSNRELRKAGQHFRDAIESDPTHINAHYYLGNLSREMQDFAGAIEAYGALVSLRPLDPSNRLRLGQAYQLNGEVAKAIEQYERATQIDANYVQARQSLANLHEQLGALDKAAHEYEVLVKLRPTPAFLGELGSLYVELERFDEAIDAYGRMLEASDDDQDSIRILLARLHANADRYDEAIAECHKVLTTSKDNGAKVEAYSILGSLYLVREQHEDALQALTAALAIREDHRDALYWLAMTYDQMGDPSLAANTLNRILTMDPSDHRAQNTLGYLYAQNGERLDEAGELVMAALEAEPSNPAYLDSLGWVRFKQGRHAEAITLLRRAATHDPANVEILDHLGDAYVEAGHQDEAVASWRQALELEPQNDGIQKKVRELSKAAGAGVE